MDGVGFVLLATGNASRRRCTCVRRSNSRAARGRAAAGPGVRGGIGLGEHHQRVRTDAACFIASAAASVCMSSSGRRGPEPRRSGQRGWTPPGRGRCGRSRPAGKGLLALRRAEPVADVVDLVGDVQRGHRESSVGWFTPLLRQRMNAFKRRVIEDVVSQTGAHDEPHIFGGPAGDPGPDRPGQHVVGDQRRPAVDPDRRRSAAIVMEILHPSVMAGVQDLSSYREEPERRGRTTFGYVVTTTFGNTEGGDPPDQRRQAHARAGQRRAPRRRPLPRARPRADRLGPHLHPVGDHGRPTTATAGR